MLIHDDEVSNRKGLNLTVFLGQSMKFEGSAVLNAIKIAQF